MNYDDSYYVANEQDSDRIALRWYASVLSRRIDKGSHVLDFGCGTGFFMVRLSKFFEVDGLDVSQTARSSSKEKMPNSQVFSDSKEIGDCTYDAITALHVLEHISNPDPTLREMYRILKPGGTGFLVVPDTDGRGHKLKSDNWFAYKDPTHCTFLSSSAWVSLCQESGFSVLVEGSDGLWDSPYTKLPRPVDRLIFGLPLIVNVLTGTLNTRPNKGECAVLIIRKPTNSKVA